MYPGLLAANVSAGERKTELPSRMRLMPLARDLDQSGPSLPGLVRTTGWRRWLHVSAGSGNYERSVAAVMAVAAYRDNLHETTVLQLTDTNSIRISKTTVIKRPETAINMYTIRMEYTGNPRLRPGPPPVPIVRFISVLRFRIVRSRDSARSSEPTANGGVFPRHAKGINRENTAGRGGY